MTGLDVCVLGSAAGGGFPQWNCACIRCHGARVDPRRYEPRTQDSVAISARPSSWFLLNASPDVTRQIEATRSLWPTEGRRSPLAGVVLTNGDIDHVLGLFQLREWQPLSVYATPRVLSGLAQNVLVKTLARFRGHVVWRVLELDREVELVGADGEASGLRVQPFAAPGKPPLHLIDTAEPSLEDNIGLRIASPSGAVAAYVSAVASLPEVLPELQGLDLLLLDGTFWSDEEPLEFGSKAAARAMGHVPISGPDGSLTALKRTSIRRRFYTHVNNTNPVLDARSPERMLLDAEGWEIARDGLVLQL